MIHGLDINAFYQEQSQYNRLIDWKALKADPLGFRFIWIKVSEGIDGTNYVEGATRCRIGAQSVNFEAILPYHYYLYQWCDWSSGAGIWRVISAKDQADAFFKASLSSMIFPILHPMMDWEDPLIDEFLQWSDTDSINKAISFARKLNAHLKSYTYAIRDLFGVLPDAYTGKWWLDKWVPLLINNGYVAEVEWFKELYYILADYDGTLNIPSYIPADRVIAWQETSTPKVPVQGIPTGRTVPGDALDIDLWMRTDEQFEIWSGQKTEAQLTTLYKTDKPQASRAVSFYLPSTAKLAVTPADLKIDSIILPMGGMERWDGSHKVLYTEASFPGRFTQFNSAGIPVIGRFNLDAGYWLKEQHTAIEVNNQYPDGVADMTDAQKIQAIRNNLVLPKLFDAWTTGGWTWDSIFAKSTKFNDIKMLELGMVETEGWNGATVSDYWQTITFNHVAKSLNWLKLKGYLPNIPVALYSGPWWLQPLQADFATMLASAKTWLYLHMGQWTLTSTATFDTLAAIYAFRPVDTFNFSYVPAGYSQRILFHEYTDQAQKCKQITDASGTPVTVSLSLYQSDAADEATFLGTPTTGLPPVDPTIAEIAAKVETLISKVSALEMDVMNLQKSINSQASTLAAHEQSITALIASVGKISAAISAIVEEWNG
jgi:hypothetical protein